MFSPLQTIACKTVLSQWMDGGIDRSENGLQNVTNEFFVYLYILDDSSIPSYVRSIFMRLDRIETSLSNISKILRKDTQGQDIEI